jgi:hypothetical protein
MKAMLAGLALAALAAAAHAQSMDTPPQTTILCIDVAGRSRPPVCRVPSGRLDPREDFCSCPATDRIVAPICPPGVRPPAENVALNHARRDALRDHPGTLVGATFEGRPMCVAPRYPARG